MDEEEAELRNPFPSPPSHYANYTSHNLKLLALLNERTSDTDLSTHNEHDILSDQTDLPPWPLAQLEKPRVDWIIEDGYYNVYGDTWFVRATFAADTRTVLRLPIRSKKLSHL
jgi:mediator of RNA polymerase II transcription subunit 7